MDRIHRKGINHVNLVHPVNPVTQDTKEIRLPFAHRFKLENGPVLPPAIVAVI